MTNNNLYQTQFELFPKSTEESVEVKKTDILFKNLTLSLENIIVLCIIFILGSVFVFSLGVERGKQIVSRINKEDLINVQDADIVQTAGQNKSVTIAVELPSEEELVEEIIPLQELEPVESASEGESIDADVYTIQVASFMQEKNAKKEAENLTGVAQDIFVLPKGKHSIVCVGKFLQRSEAKEFSGKLKNRYGDCLVRRL